MGQRTWSGRLSRHPSCLELRAVGETGGMGRQVSLGLWAGPVLTAGLSDELSGRAGPGIDIFWELGSSLIFPLHLCLRHQVLS